MDPNYQFRWQQFAHYLIDDLVQHPEATLPGVQVLGERYKVSRTTVEHALKYLEGLGIIAPVQHGKKRQINLTQLQQASSRQEQLGNRVLFLSGNPDSPGHPTKKIYEHFHTCCEQENLFLCFIEVPSEPSAVRDLLTALQPRGVIFNWVPEFVEEIVYSLNIPAIGIGQGSALVSKFNSSNNELRALAFEQAREAGHRRIMTPFWNIPDTQYEETATELENLLSLGGASYSRRYNFPSMHGSDMAQYFEGLHDLFRYTPPSCIILYDISHYLAVISLLMKKKMRVPDDISVIVLHDSPLMTYMVPTIARFRLFSDETIIQAFHVLQEKMRGFQTCEQEKITPVWVPGDSLAPPKSR